MDSTFNIYKGFLGIMSRESTCSKLLGQVQGARVVLMPPKGDSITSIDLIFFKEKETLMTQDLL